MSKSIFQREIRDHLILTLRKRNFLLVPRNLMHNKHFAFKTVWCSGFFYKSYFNLKSFWLVEMIDCSVVLNNPDIYEEQKS